MHSWPFTSPSRQAGELSTCVSHHSYGRTSVADDEVISLVEWDLETDRLLPPRQRQHCVRIQGRLAIVRTVSVTNRRPVKNGSRFAHMNRSREGMDASRISRRCSYPGSGVGGGDDDNVAERDEQLRGYGIGGAGNIRL